MSEKPDTGEGGGLGFCFLGAGSGARARSARGWCSFCWSIGTWSDMTALDLGTSSGPIGTSAVLPSAIACSASSLVSVPHCAIVRLLTSVVVANSRHSSFSLLYSARA